MALTALQIIDQAQGRSSLNDSDLLSNTLQRRYLDNFQRQAFIRAARENPEYFGTSFVTIARAAFGDAWDLSGQRIAAVTKVIVDTITGTVAGVSTGDTISLVHFLHQSLGLVPRAYIRNRKVTDVGTELGAADANMVTKLEVFYSPLPASLTADASILLLPDEWADLLVLPLARVLAVRDGQREGEVTALAEEFALVFEQFTEAVKMFDHGAIRPLTAIKPQTGPLGASPSGPA